MGFTGKIRWVLGSLAGHSEVHLPILLTGVSEALLGPASFYIFPHNFLLSGQILIKQRSKCLELRALSGEIHFWWPNVSDLHGKAKLIFM